MNLLYPRLLIEQAKPLHEQYRMLDVQELGHRAETSHQSAIYAATGGDRVSTGQLAELRDGALQLATQHGFPAESSRDARREFDLRLAEYLHVGMKIIPAEAASGDIWAFLAVVLLPDVAYWRYPHPPGDRVLGTDITRHVLGRLWWRAQLVHSPDEPDSYKALEVLGEAAFDQIYARRKALGGSPMVVKAILRTWSALELDGLEERAVLRDFLQRLLRLSPFVAFEALDAVVLEGELRAVALETMEAIRAAREGASRPMPD
ncbi:hypothetical protein EV649_8152 [Kribbella sp. VKM Ac-2569]|uniref:DUF6339 family protein n=1 Tax=Kribbella sp. VKM Ac-2569 TaxID=2512220 RepID=UPI00102CABD6|nr:DUF6339 family protein [Kribbella sp. VKM Ac-2569]RZT07445.1 hypothetical protein EV649_8152 [Kribbella sp. VKM Ac-2569]